MKLFFNSDFQATAASFSVKRGDDLKLDLVFLDESRSPIVSDLAAVTFGAKAKGNYSGGFLLYADGFEAGTTTDGKPCLSALIHLNTEALNELLSDSDNITVSAEFEFHKRGFHVSSQTLKVIVNNDVIKGQEGTPTGTIPAYATIEYVDVELKKLVEEYIGDSVQQAEDSATEATNQANQAAQSAEESAARASESSASAEESAVSAAEAEGSAQRAEETTIAKIDIDKLTTAQGENYTYDSVTNVFSVDMQNKNSFVRVFAVEEGLPVVTLRLLNVRDGDYLRVYVNKPAGVLLRLLPAEGEDPLALMDGSKINNKGEYLFTVVKLRDKLKTVSIFLIN